MLKRVYCEKNVRRTALISGPERNSHETYRSGMQAGIRCQAGQRGDVTLLFCASTRAHGQVHAASRAHIKHGVMTLVRPSDIMTAKRQGILIWVVSQSACGRVGLRLGHWAPLGPSHWVALGHWAPWVIKLDWIVLGHRAVWVS